ncbi:hypothetical protein SERLA73DRAFT_181818 [Serpula lacrymans var. lacrymans S7.3]|uniref:Uncharacterized protein n=1 Tax=Serpula lacrymans var. lacrymans (strain S7.3) TaxID=936435 RepID=F8PYS5_SERL3|nr:hypothetical protein SERLA73DRAFT_181818 [Serpula lacrymans var. lacrymans S7.3]
MQLIRPGPGGSGSSQGNTNMQIPPDVAAQMQKLLDQKGIRPQSLAVSSHPPTHQTSNTGQLSQSASPEAESHFLDVQKVGQGP